MYVIKDLRDGKVYIDDSSFIRVFEQYLETDISLKKAKEKYPDAIDCRQKTEA